jgi:hypothetical protein
MQALLPIIYSTKNKNNEGSQMGHTKKYFFKETCDDESNLFCKIGN